MHDVVVVGAGPTGCYAARQLARLGYEVLVLEEHFEVGEPVHCTGVIGLEVYERFDLDRGCVEAKLFSARFVSPSGQSFRVAADEPKAVVVDRRRFDQTLAEEALAAGASFLLGTRVESILPQERSAIVAGECLGEPVSFRASLAIVATGTDDTLTEKLGLAGAVGESLFGAQLFAQPGDLDEVEVHLGRSVAPGGFAWAVPANGHRCRVGLLSRQHPQTLLKRFAHTLAARGAIRCNGGHVRYRRVPAGARTPSYGDRLLVVGDAAGQVKTTTSGGIYYGLLGAEAAVRTADRALRTRNLTASGLAPYEQQWLSEVGAEQRTGRALRRLYAALNDRDFDALFWLARRIELPKALGRLSFDWHTSGLLTVLWRDVIGAATTGLRGVRVRATAGKTPLWRDGRRPATNLRKSLPPEWRM